MHKVCFGFAQPLYYLIRQQELSILGVTITFVLHMVSCMCVIHPYHMVETGEKGVGLGDVWTLERERDSGPRVGHCTWAAFILVVCIFACTGICKCICI